ncbi:MAG: ABC transporter permease subunit, partial [Spirulina sp.]
LQTIPINRYEAAELDGAGPWQKFWYVTLPGLQPTLVFATVTTVIFTLIPFLYCYNLHPIPHFFWGSWG